jgi:4-hydroxybenzoyl-CoA reductase subunit beta
VAKKEQVCYSTYCGDVAPALLVMNAEVVLTRADGSKQVALESIYSGEGKTPLNLQHGEILTEIVISEQAADGFSTYKKIANRGSIDFPIVGAALWASSSTGEARIAFTAVDRKPVRAKQLEEYLRGKQFNEETAQAVDSLVAKEAHLMLSSIDSISYKRKLMGQLAKEALSEAVGGK